MEASRIPISIRNAARRGAGRKCALALFGAVLVWRGAALATDANPSTTSAVLGPALTLLSSTAASKPPHSAAAVTPAKRAGAPSPAAHAHATPASKQLIPPAPLPVTLDPPPKERSALPLETDLQPLGPPPAPLPSGPDAGAKPPAG
jgi:hypothetical protein